MVPSLRRVRPLPRPRSAWPQLPYSVCAIPPPAAAPPRPVPCPTWLPAMRPAHGGGGGVGDRKPDGLGSAAHHRCRSCGKRKKEIEHIIARDLRALRDMCKANRGPLSTPTADSYDPAPGLTLSKIRATIPAHCFVKCDPTPIPCPSAAATCVVGVL